MMWLCDMVNWEMMCCELRRVHDSRALETSVSMHGEISGCKARPRRAHVTVLQSVLQSTLRLWRQMQLLLQLRRCCAYCMVKTRLLHHANLAHHQEPKSKHLKACAFFHDRGWLLRLFFCWLVVLGFQFQDYVQDLTSLRTVLVRRALFVGNVGADNGQADVKPAKCSRCKATSCYR